MSDLHEVDCPQRAGIERCTWGCLVLAHGWVAHEPAAHERAS